VILNTIEISGEEVNSGVVKPDWIDANDHMNVAYYVLAFDQAIHSHWEKLGMTDNFVSETFSSTFAVESHITWQKEMRINEPYFITTQILSFDSKRIHQFMRMYHAEKKFIAATAEWLNLHINLDARKVTPWPDMIFKKISKSAKRHEIWNWPKEAGKKIQVPKPL
tara:strand:+ start:121 stop:618 length:498 start_codon:yes stop_codon:yes gene_type:complete